MRYSKIYKNDTAAGKGINVSVYLQGCPHMCQGCFNPETWDHTQGYPFTEDTMKEILDAIGANGIQRNLSILGGEPLAPWNLELTEYIVNTVRLHYPNIKIYLWTGYILEELDEKQKLILLYLDYLIDGPYIEAERDITLQMRGSKNQRIIKLR